LKHLRLAALFLAILAPPGNSAADIPGWLARLPVTAGMRRTGGGIVEINTVPAAWSVYSGGTAEGCRSEAARLGWKNLGEFSASLPSPSGGMTVAGYRRNGDPRMLVMVLPARGGGAVVMAVLSRPLELLDGRGEAPGRDPAGIPRLPSARRLLHLVGGKIEAAFYSSPAGPPDVLKSARRMLEARGWQAQGGAGGILLASRAGSPGLAYFVAENAGGSRYLVFTTGRKN